MIWEFKQRLFVSQRRVSPQSVADLSSAGVRAQLQAHIDGSEHLPTPGAPDEYAGLFEAVYPAEADRRTYMVHTHRQRPARCRKVRLGEEGVVAAATRLPGALPSPRSNRLA
jgi:hypothetical protein